MKTHRFLTLVASAGLALALTASCGTGAPPAASGSQKLTVVVLVVDSLMPGEINTTTTPNLQVLKNAGTFYAESRSVFSAETIPNHVAMMTGVYPQRNGIPTNDFIDDFSVAAPVAVKLSIPERLTANTLFTWIKRRCVDSGNNPAIHTGATLSKKYLYDIFAGDAKNTQRANDNPRVFNVPPDAHWDPTKDRAYIGPPDEHTPDVNTMTAAIAAMPAVDFHFINLGDVDRSAHAGGLSARNAVLPDTDRQVGLFVQHLKDTNRWDNTVLIVLSDHGMDFTDPGPAMAITTQGTLNSLNTACGKLKMQVVPSGGTESIYVLDRGASLAQRQDTLRAARTCLTDSAACAAICPGTPAPTNAALIGGAWYIADDPLDSAGTMPPSIASKNANLGDLTVYAKAGGKFNEPATSANGQIPGNHGQPVTLRNTFIVTGGSPWVKKGQVIASSVASPSAFDRLPEQSENVDVASTVAWLLGLNILPGDFPDAGQGFDGRILKEAFTQFDGNAEARSPTQCGLFD